MNIRIFAVSLFTIAITLFSAGTAQAQEKSKQKMKADFIGFSDDLTPSYTRDIPLSTPFMKQNPPFDLLTEAGKKSMENAVLSLQQGSNTCALYALDAALERIEFVQKKYMDNDPKTKYYIVMLTDGLDNKSLTLAESRGAGRYESREAYGQALQERMTKLMKNYTLLNIVKEESHTNPFQSFILLYKGHDIIESGYSNEQLHEILLPYTGAQNAERPDPIQHENLDSLLTKFEGELISRSFSFKIQKDYAGKRFKMLLNDTKDEAKQIYFEADLVRVGSSFELQNINTSENFKVRINPKYVDENTSITFTANDLQLNERSYPVDRTAVSQWIMDYGQFRKNSEYTFEIASQKNAYIMVLLDASLSFKEKYQDAQNAVLEIIKMIEEL